MSELVTPGGSPVSGRSEPAPIHLPGKGVRVHTPEGSRTVPRVGRNGLPECPWDIQDAVEQYARRHGRSAKMHFAPVVGWFVRFSLRPNDPRVRAYQEGRALEPPTEDVYFHVPNPKDPRPGSYMPLDILQLGVSGVIRFLEKGNTWSGRGQFRSVEEAAAASIEANKKVGERERAKQKQLARDQAQDKRRSLLGIPFHRVGIDLKKK